MSIPVPPILNLPTNVPTDVQGVGQFLTQALIALQTWAATLQGTVLGAVADGYVYANISGALAIPTGNGLSQVIDHVCGSTVGYALKRTVSGWQAAQLAFGDLSGTIAGAQIAAGTVTNAMLANSSMTLAGHVVSLGGVQTFAAADLTNGTSGSGLVVLATSPSISGLTVTGSFTATGLVTNADLANSSMTLAGHVVSLGGTQTFAAADLTNGTTGSGLIVLATSPVLTTPNLGTPSAGTLTNCTGLPNAGLVNSSITVGSTNISLGATAATVSGLTLSGGTLTGVTAIPNGQIGSAGALLLGSTQSITVSGIGVPVFQYLRTDDLPAGWFNFEAGGATLGSRQIYGRSRGTVTTAGAVTSGDYLALFQFFGDDGSTNSTLTTQAARLDVVVDGTVATGIIPGRFVFSTMNTGGTFAERMRLTSAGGLALGTTTDPGSGNFLANGTVAANAVGSKLPDQINPGITPCTATTSFTSNTTLATVTGMTTPTLTAGKTYRIEGHLAVSAGASGGIKVQLTATGLTVTSCSINMQAYAGTTLSANTTTTALGASALAVTAAVTDVYFQGIIVVNAAGTISLQAAQNVSNATTTSVLVNSYMEVDRGNA